MEMAHINSATVGADMIVSSAPASANSPPVYNETTVPLTSKQPSPVAPAVHEEDTKFDLKTFNNLPERKPVDIQFKDISYCVKAGFRKGEKQCEL